MPEASNIRHWIPIPIVISAAVFVPTVCGIASGGMSLRNGLHAAYEEANVFSTPEESAQDDLTEVTQKVTNTKPQSFGNDLDAALDYTGYPLAGLPTTDISSVTV